MEAKNNESEKVNNSHGRINNLQSIMHNNDTSNETSRREAEPPPKNSNSESRYFYNNINEASAKVKSDRKSTFNEGWKEIKNGKPRKILCNIHSCRNCNENWKPKPHPSNNENTNENDHKNNKKTYKRVLECLKDCSRCRKIIDRINNSDAWREYTNNKPIVEQNKNKNSQPDITIDLENDNNEELEKKIKSLKITNLETSIVNSNGNCLYSSMSLAMNRNEESHTELRGLHGNISFFS